MSLNRSEKTAVVAAVAQQLQGTQTMVLAEYRGISVAAMTRLRVEARKREVYLHVVKNTLARRAVKGTPFEGLSQQMTGPLIYGLSADPVAAAKVLVDFGKQEAALVVKTGIYDGRVLEAGDVKELAAIPGREELLSKLLFVMQSPLSGMARALGALAAKKGQGEPAAAAGSGQAEAAPVTEASSS